MCNGVRAGSDTKIMLNDKGPRFKKSKLDHVINVEAIIFCALILALMCLFCAIGQWIWTTFAQGPMSPYIPIDESNLLGGNILLTAVISFLTFVIFYQVLNFSFLFFIFHAFSLFLLINLLSIKKNARIYLILIENFLSVF